MHARSTHRGQTSYRHEHRSPPPKEAAATITLLHSEGVGTQDSPGACPAARGPHRCSTQLMPGSGRGVRGPVMGLWSQVQVQPIAGPRPPPTSLSPITPPHTHTHIHAYTHAHTLLIQKTNTGLWEKGQEMTIQITNAHRSIKKILAPKSRKDIIQE